MPNIPAVKKQKAWWYSLIFSYLQIFQFPKQYYVQLVEGILLLLTGIKER